MREYSSTTITPADGVKVPSMNGSTSGNFLLSALRDYILASKGQANGLASLDANGKLPVGELPDLADDVLVYASLGTFPGTGTAGKIYIAADTNIMYRWDPDLTTPNYVELSSDLSGYATISDLLDGTIEPLISTKAKKDQNGNVIDQTYETKADASDLKSAISSNTARIENLEQEHGGLVEVQYRGTNAVPTGKAKYAMVESIVGKSRAWNNLVDTGTTSVTLTSGHSFLTVISGNASIVSGTGQSVSVTGGTDIVRDLTLIFPEGVPSTVAECVQKCPDILTYDSYGYGIKDTIVGGVKSVGFNRLDLASYMQTLGISKSGDYYSDTIRTGWGDKSYANPFPINWQMNTRYSFRLTGYVSSSSSPYLYVKYTDGTIDGLCTLSSTSLSTVYDTSASGKTIEKVNFSYGSGGDNTLYIKSITISIGTDTTKDADYMETTLPLPSAVTLRSAGSVAEELDVESGDISHPIGTVDLGSLTWTYDSGEGCYWANISDRKDEEFEGTCAKYNKGASAYSNTNMTWTWGAYHTPHEINIFDSTISPPDASAFKTSLNGVYLYYELATPSADTNIGATPNCMLPTEAGGTINTIQTQTPQIDNCLDVAYLAL